ncbi:hypothetical protein F0U60_44175 [Archangium minus]|uniref:Peptidase metallopeptidase domain-containing protein n=2 Tax=Archangium minus TaxID=83450 RepID=A0ABY9X4S1_9BACT|nr:hypothetical protein F0U60_44175 [Archangium minus]
MRKTSQYMRQSLRGATLLLGVWLGIGCDSQQQTSVPSDEPVGSAMSKHEEGFKKFKANAVQDPQTGLYIVDGDVPVRSLEEMREYYDSLQLPSNALSLRRAGVYWDASERRQLTYCIEKSVFENDHYNKVVWAMKEAAKQWEETLDVDFTHIQSEDATCSAFNGNVMFGVSRHTSFGGMINAAAFAFYPDFMRINRTLMITRFGLDNDHYDLTDTLRHELGHILGFQHEHLRPESGASSDCSTEPDLWFANPENLTPYDAQSVMHYNGEKCHGQSNDKLSQLDIEGAQRIYPPAARALQAKGDFNGDGLLDASWYSPGTREWVVELSRQQGGPRQVRHNVSHWGHASAAYHLRVGDFNGDGRDDWSWVSYWTDEFVVMFSNGAGGWTERRSTGSGYLVYARHFNVGDFNADGATDWAYYDGFSTFVVRLSLRNGAYWTAYNDTSGWGDWSSGQHFSTGDFNGDGATDWSWYAAWSNDFIVMLSSRDGHFSSVSNDTSGWGNWQLARHFSTGDFNGDGATDWSWYAPWSNEFIVMMSRRDGHYDAAGNNTSGWGNWSEGRFFSTGDFNGDGATDWSWYSPGTNDFIVMMSTRDGHYFATGNDTSFWGNWSAAANFLVDDLNGDGAADWTWAAPWSNGFIVMLSTGDGHFSGADIYNSPGHQPRMAADVNGDGKQDLVGFGEIGVFVSLSTGTSFTPARMWLSNFGRLTGGWDPAYHVRTLADVNGDGKQDVVGFSNWGTFVALSTGSSFASAQMWTSEFGYETSGWRVDKHPRVLADVNGDGKQDVVAFSSWATLVALSTGSSFAPAQVWISDFGYESGGWRVDKHLRVLADVNGDGKQDIVGFGDRGTQVALSTGSSFTPTQEWTPDLWHASSGWQLDLHPRVLADVNGDGKQDVVAFSSWATLVALSTGSSFAPTQVWIATYGYEYDAGGWRVDKHLRLFGDVNGDGKQDLVGLGNDGIYLSLSTGSSFTAPQWMGDAYGYDSGGWRVDQHPRMLADVNGDGRQDIVGMASYGTHVTLSNGTGYQNTEFWAEDFGMNVPAGYWQP